MTNYATDYARRLRVTRSGVTPIGGGIPTTTAELIGALATSVRGEVFIRIDPATLADIAAGASNTGYLYPIAIEVENDGDVILHVTDGDRAQDEIADEPVSNDRSRVAVLGGVPVEHGRRYVKVTPEVGD